MAKYLRIDLAIQENDSAIYSNALAKTTFVAKLPSDRASLEPIIGHTIEALILTYTDASMEEANLLAGVINAKVISAPQNKETTENDSETENDSNDLEDLPF